MSQELIKKADFVGALFFSLVGREPKESEKIVLNAILVSPVDYKQSVVEAMNVFKKINDNSDDIEKSAMDLVNSYKSNKEVVPGFGHSIHKDFDPRAKALFEVARKNDLNIQFMNIARQIEHSLEEVFNETLPLNIDGAVAALLLTLGIHSEDANKIPYLTSYS